MQKGVFFLADVHEHGFEARLNVFDAAFKDAAYDVVFAFALDGVFFQYAVSRRATRRSSFSALMMIVEPSMGSQDPKPKARLIF